MPTFLHMKDYLFNTCTFGFHDLPEHITFLYSLLDVYICGGFDTHTIFGDIWKFSLQTYTWTKLPCSLQVPVYFHSADVTQVHHSVLWNGQLIILINYINDEPNPDMNGFPKRIE